MIEKPEGSLMASRCGQTVVIVTVLVGTFVSITAAYRREPTSVAITQKPTARAESVESLEARAARIHREAIVLDGHLDTIRSMERSGWKFKDRHDVADSEVDLPRMKEGGVTGAFVAIDGNDQMKGPAVIEDTLRNSARAT